MSDVEVTYKEPLSREETARCLSALATALADEGEVELELGATRMKVHVPADLRCKVEVEIDRDEVEFEVELTWSMAARVPTASPEEHAEQETADDPSTEAHRSGRRKAAAR